MRITGPLAVAGSLEFGISGPPDCHVYALRGPDGIVLVDAGGTDTERILDKLQAGLEFRAIHVSGHSPDSFCLLTTVGVSNWLFTGHGIFTLRNGQSHLDCVIAQAGKNFLPHQIGQGDLRI